MQPKSQFESSALQVIERSDRNARKNSVRRGTGPRTAQGKQRSKRNATKHGFFSSIVLPWESAADYQSLLTGLREDLQPEGELEELLVDKLAMLMWRQRRLLAAERAEIEVKPAVSSANIDTLLQQLSVHDTEYPLMRAIGTPAVLKCCLKLLNELREQIEVDSSEDRMAVILGELYGAGKQEETDRYHPLVQSYLYWRAAVLTSETGRQHEGSPGPEERRQSLLRDIDAEIKSLEAQRTANASTAAHRTELENDRRSLPAAKWLDRSQRYEAGIERSFDRTLSQLERLQRMRRGQPVAPRIDVSLSD